jgi:hypothetical protein
VEEDELGVRSLVWAAGGETTSIAVSANKFAIGDGANSLKDSQLTQDDTNQAIATTYDVNCKALKVQSPIAQGGTMIGAPNTQTKNWKVFFDFSNLDLIMGSGQVAPLWAKYYGDNTISIFVETGEIPEIIVNSPAFDHGLAVWNGHDSLYEDKIINSIPTITLQNSTLSNVTFTDELIITSHASNMYAMESSGNIVYINTVKASIFYVDYAVNIQIQFLGEIQDGHKLTLAFKRINSGGLITWPSTWRWPFTIVPNSSLFPVGEFSYFSVQRIGTIYFAMQLTGQLTVLPNTTNVITLGSHRDNSPLNFFDNEGYKLEIVEKGSIYSNVLSGLVLDMLCLIKANYSSSRNVALANNVLDIVFGANTPNVVRVLHDQDINLVNITFDIDEIPTDITFRFAIIILKDVSDQTSIPLPSGVKAPTILETNTLELGTQGHTIFNFQAIPGNGVYYLGANAQW